MCTLPTGGMREQKSIENLLAIKKPKRRNVELFLLHSAACVDETKVIDVRLIIKKKRKRKHKLNRSLLIGFRSKDNQINLFYSFYLDSFVYSAFIVSTTKFERKPKPFIDLPRCYSVTSHSLETHEYETIHVVDSFRWLTFLMLQWTILQSNAMTLFTLMAKPQNTLKSCRNH